MKIPFGVLASCATPRPSQPRTPNEAGPSGACGSSPNLTLLASGEWCVFLCMTVCLCVRVHVFVHMCWSACLCLFLCVTVQVCVRVLMLCAVCACMCVCIYACESVCGGYISECVQGAHGEAIPPEYIAESWRPSGALEAVKPRKDQNLETHWKWSPPHRKTEPCPVCAGAGRICRHYKWPANRCPATKPGPGRQPSVALVSLAPPPGSVFMIMEQRRPGQQQSACAEGTPGSLPRYCRLLTGTLLLPLP